MSDDELISTNLFEEPEDFRPPPPEAHFAKYERKYAKSHPEINEITLRLIGKSPLWGHLLWNAGVYTANFIDKHPDYVKNKVVVELGAASGLPSLLCSLNDAKTVIATDYPEPALIQNIEYNIEHLNYPKAKEIIKVQDYIWGNAVDEIKERIGGDEYADLMILSDLVFNHSEHHKLLKSCKDLIKPLNEKKEERSGGKCLVVFSPHRPKLIENDLKFFEDAKEMFGFDVEKIEMIHWDHPMFPEEEKETEEIRKRVYCYLLHPTW